MRGKELARRATGIDTWYFIVALSAILVVLYVVFSAPDAFAQQTREEIKFIDDESDRLEDTLIDVNKDIILIQNEIDEAEDTLKDLRQDLRVLKRHTTDNLADQKEISEKETEIFGQRQIIDTLKKQKLALLDDRSSYNGRLLELSDKKKSVSLGIVTTDVALTDNTNLSLQTTIDELEIQLDLLHEISENLRISLRDNASQINTLENRLLVHEQTLADIRERAKSSWGALAALEGAQTLVDNTVQNIDILKEQRILLENDDLATAREIRTAQSVIEQASGQLLENNINRAELEPLIGIQLSKSCIMLLQNNFPNNCPSYGDLILMDSSDLDISGKFVEDENGWIHRAEPGYRNSWVWYEDNDDRLRIIVDPPPGMAERIPLITITNNFGVYFTPSDLKLADDGLAYYHEGRHIKDCRTALLSTDHWNRMIADTIDMLRSGCQTTTIEDHHYNVIEKTEFDPKTSDAWKYRQWVNESLERCKTTCWEY